MYASDGIDHTEQILLNAQTPPVSDDVLASRLARKSRRNEIGVAMQMIEQGRQGDIMLYDGI